MEIQHRQHPRGGVFVAIEDGRELGEMTYGLEPAH